MIDLDSLLQKAQTSANPVNTDPQEGWKSEPSNGNTFDDIFKDQLESKRAAKDGKTLPDPNTKTTELEARVLGRRSRDIDDWFRSFDRKHYK